MAQEISPLRRLIQHLQTHKTKSVLIGVGLSLILLYLVAFFIPKSVHFSYAGDTCVSQLTLFPGMHKAANDDLFAVSFRDTVNIGSTALVSTKTCFAAASEPKPGEFGVATAPFGGIVARKNFVVTVPHPPVAQVAHLTKPLPVSKPLLLPLSQPDAVFDYDVQVATKTAECDLRAAQLACDIPALKLKQGKQYSLTLTRQFQQTAKTTLTKQDITTLRAIKIKKASLRQGQTVYHKPKSFTFTTDKPIARAEVTLIAAGKQPKALKTTTKLTSKTLKVALASDLARETKHQLVIKQLEATDGSTLVEPKKLSFTTSGGPKVVGVNIGTTRVSSSAVATIRFDQAVKTADIKKHVRLRGGSAVITGAGKSVQVALQGLPRCKAFSLTVAKGLASKHGIKSKTAWSYDSRTLCHTVSTYGTSLQGRPLNAYIFGNSGPTTMYVGAIHGNESSSSVLMKAWIEELERHPAQIGQRRIVVIPTINPDGVAANTRTNARGVNLSRNFPTDNWVRSIDDTDGKHKNGGGKKPLSEPESKALAAITKQYRPRLLLSFHAIGSLVVGDPGGYSAGYAAKYASMLGYRDATGGSGTFDYSITGAYEDWTYRNEGIPSMVIELGDYGYADINAHKAALWAMLR